MEERERRRKVKRTIEIYEYQDKFLKEHPEINFSALVRKMLDELMKQHDDYRTIIGMFR